jgi:hypothetical protein
MQLTGIGQKAVLENPNPQRGTTVVFSPRFEDLCALNGKCHRWWGAEDVGGAARFVRPALKHLATDGLFPRGNETPVRA